MLDWSGLNVRAKSPDGFVQATMNDQCVVEVSFAPARGLERYNEQSLTEQINLALTGVHDGFLRAFRKVVDNIRTEFGPDTGPPRDPGLPERLAKIDVEEMSPRKYVKCRQHDSGDPRVRLKPGTLRQAGIDKAQLATEINLVLEMVRQKYSNRVADTSFIESE